MIDMKKKAEDILEDYTYSYSQIDLEILAKFLDQIRIEAIKEFWNTMKSQNTLDRRIISVESGDNLIKEMVGDE